MNPYTMSLPRKRHRSCGIVVTVSRRFHEASGSSTGARLARTSEARRRPQRETRQPTGACHRADRLLLAGQQQARGRCRLHFLSWTRTIGASSASNRGSRRAGRCPSGPLSRVINGRTRPTRSATRPPSSGARACRYELTGTGRRLAVFFTKTYTRIVNPSLAELDPTLPETIARGTPLGRPWREFERALAQRIADAALTA
jgi:hypothetical protein